MPVARISQGALERSVIRPEKMAGYGFASNPPCAPASIVVASMPVPTTNEFGDVPDHLLLDAGVAVLGEGAAGIGGDRVSMGEGAAVHAA